MPTADEFKTLKSRTSLYDYATSHLKRIRGGLVCPSCESGTGPNRTPAFSIKGDMFKCFSCNVSGDIFDLAGMVSKASSKSEQLKIVRNWSGEKPLAHAAEQALDERAAFPSPSRLAKRLPAHMEELNDKTAVSYLESRGFTVEETRCFGLSFDKEKKRIAIPYPGNPWYHIDRDVTGNAKAKYVKPRFEEAGAEPVFNPDAVRSDHVFIVEGPFDYMAVKLAGFEATALCGTSWRKTAEHIVESGYEGSVTVALDNDEPGILAASQMKNFLERAGIGVHAPDSPWDDYKDAAELFESDRQALAKHLEKMKSECLERRKALKSDEYARAFGSLRVLNPAEALKKSISNGHSKVLPTGMSKIDDALEGGFHTGNLYVIGAVSSLGKTTLCLQLADLLSASGNEVLYVTLEQSAAELAAKSVSRIMSSQGFEASSGDVLRSDRRMLWDEGKRASFERSMLAYESEISIRLRIVEGQERPNARDVRLAAEAVADRTGTRPIVFVDYLQLLSPFNERSTDKQSADDNVRALKHLARDLNCPVIAISSLNRGSYSAGIDLSSWKESGLIEYTADVLLGMQIRNYVQKLQGPERESRRKASQLMEQAKSQRVRDVELIVLKNRSGAVIGSDGAVQLRYDALTNTFT